MQCWSFPDKVNQNGRSDLYIKILYSIMRQTKNSVLHLKCSFCQSLSSLAKRLLQVRSLQTDVCLRDCATLCLMNKTNTFYFQSTYWKVATFDFLYCINIQDVEFRNFRFSRLKSLYNWNYSVNYFARGKAPNLFSICLKIAQRSFVA